MYKHVQPYKSIWPLTTQTNYILWLNRPETCKPRHSGAATGCRQKGGGRVACRISSYLKNLNLEKGDGNGEWAIRCSVDS